MKVYTIAKKVSFPEHGGSHEETHIVKMGAYGAGLFPPLFYKKEEAELYLSTIEYNSEYFVVDLTIYQIEAKNERM